MEQAPKWLPSFLRKKLAPKFAAACGQFIAFNKNAYSKINGHESVKNQIIEDVELAKNIKISGLTLKMLHGVGSVFAGCIRMTVNYGMASERTFCGLW